MTIRAVTLFVIAGCGRVGFSASTDASVDVYVPPDIVVQPGCGARGMAVGELHTCVLVENGGTYCTGENMFGELGTGAVSANVDTPILASRIVGATTLRAGRGFTTFIDGSDIVRCVGINSNRQCGVPTSANELEVVTAAGVPASTRIATGYSVVCATTTAGDAYCWGDGDEGQAGNGTSAGSHAPEPVPALAGTNPIISVGGTHVCAALPNDTIQCWGDARALRLGTSGPDTCPNASAGSIQCATQPIALAVSPLGRVSAGDEHTCALTPTGQVWCWGANEQGQIGVAKSPAEVPQRVGTFDGVLQVVSGGDHTCVLEGDGTVRCWGDNFYQQLGTGGGDRIAPVTIALPEKAVSVQTHATGDHTCAILEGGTVWCWGAGTEGQLGRGPQTGGGPPSPMLLPCP